MPPPSATRVRSRRIQTYNSFHSGCARSCLKRSRSADVISRASCSTRYSQAMRSIACVATGLAWAWPVRRTFCVHAPGSRPRCGSVLPSSGTRRRSPVIVAGDRARPALQEGHRVLDTSAHAEVVDHARRGIVFAGCIRPHVGLGGLARAEVQHPHRGLVDMQDLRA
jgi:hypothetical protein